LPTLSKEKQKVLDDTQYTNNGILRYEKIFGEGFISTGGLTTTQELFKRMNLKKGMKVLDVGCGIGGGDLLMAKKYGVDVYGIDLSANMLNIAKDRLKKTSLKQGSVEYEECDAMTRDFKDGEFDIIYSRDCILHVADKVTLFKRFYKWLKSGGGLYISDYCRGEDSSNEEFEAYVKQRNYTLYTVKKYGSLIEQAGFETVKANDITDLFVTSLKAELDRFKKIKDEFIAEFTKEDFDHINDGWEVKLVRSAKGYQHWGWFVAQKQ